MTYDASEDPYAAEVDEAKQSLECFSCGEVPEGECPNSERPCGHHCNHSWTHDQCCWCGQMFDESE